MVTQGLSSSVRSSVSGCSSLTGEGADTPLILGSPEGVVVDSASASAAAASPTTPYSQRVTPVTTAPSTALLTDHYELTMLQAALAAGTAHRRAVFELFPRRLPEGRRYGVLARGGRALDAVERFRFDAETLEVLQDHAVVDGRTLEWLADYRFRGD